MSRLIKPNSSLFQSLDKIRKGGCPLQRTFLAEEYCEDDKIEVDWWVADEQSKAYFKETKDIVRKRYGSEYVYVERIEIKYRREWLVELFLEEAGEMALNAVDQGFVWDMEEFATDMPATEEFYREWSSRSQLTDEEFSTIAGISHPALKQIKQMFVVRKLISVRDGKAWVVPKETA